MSTEAVKQFWQKAQQDKALQAKLAAIQEKERQAILTAVVKLATEAGFVFTAQEYDAAVKEELAKQHAAGEITDEVLEQVAGGRLSGAVFQGVPPPTTSQLGISCGCV